jgi:hypothetical protein
MVYEETLNKMRKVAVSKIANKNDIHHFFFNNQRLANKEFALASITINAKYYESLMDCVIIF